MFNEKSGLVQVWVKLISDENGRYSKDDIPNLSNLREVVIMILDKSIKPKH